MESLQLPADLFWNVKMEPNSPPGEQLFATHNGEDAWILEDSFESEIFLSDDNITELFDQSSSDEILAELEFEIKEERWVDVKPMSHQHMMEYATPITPQPSLVKVQNPYEIIMDLETAYGAPTELTQLTPPQTPPQQAQEINEIFDFISRQPHLQHQIVCPDLVTPNNNNANIIDDQIIPVLSPAASSCDYSSDSANSPMPQDIAREVQFVDDFLRTRAKDLPDSADDNDSMFSMLSSSASNSNDDEWSASSPSFASSIGSPVGGKMTHELPKKRTRPYGRGQEERKSRKKEQNKNAATRYRQKKKEEMKVVLDEEHQLLARNEELSKQASEIEREVKYLKKLIKEFYKNKKSA